MLITLNHVGVHWSSSRRVQISVLFSCCWSVFLGAESLSGAFLGAVQRLSLRAEARMANPMPAIECHRLNTTELSTSDRSFQ